MRTAILVVAIAAAAMASPAGAGLDSDQVNGSGKFAMSGSAIATAAAFNVSVRGTGTDASGHVNYRGVTFTGEEMSGHADVICADIRGDRAVVIAKFNGDSPFGPGFDFAQLFVEDNGHGKKSAPDRALATAAPNSPEGGPPNCLFTDAAFAAIAALSAPIEHGNVSVH